MNIPIPGLKKVDQVNEVLSWQIRGVGCDATELKLSGYLYAGSTTDITKLAKYVALAAPGKAGSIAAQLVADGHLTNAFSQKLQIKIEIETKRKVPINKVTNRDIWGLLDITKRANALVEAQRALKEWHDKNPKKDLSSAPGNLRLNYISSRFNLELAVDLFHKVYDKNQQRPKLPWERNN